MTRRKILIASLTAVVALIGKSLAQTTTASPKSPDLDAIAERNVKELLLLMDTDKNGRISKREWMDFMSREFDELDKNKNGELDPKELMKSRFVVSHVSPEVQGK
jgi:Ca2+-binding EF-hand superfamily protein